MLFNKTLLIIEIVLYACVSYSQTDSTLFQPDTLEDHVGNVLRLYQRPYYSEINVIKKDQIFTLVQRICYNRPNVIDEEFCYELTLMFFDTAVAKQIKTINLAIDKSIIQSEYGVFSVWNWENESNEVHGKIEIISWSKDEITLKENIYVYDIRRNEKIKFVGKRTFKRSG